MNAFAVVSSGIGATSYALVLITSPAFDPSSLTDEERQLFSSLSPEDQISFALLTPKQRAYCMTLLDPALPSDAVWKAAWQDVLGDVVLYKGKVLVVPEGFYISFVAGKKIIHANFI